MAKKEAPRDLYMQFKDVSGQMAASATTLNEREPAPGMSIRGMLAFLIHKIEIWSPDWGTNTRGGTFALSTISGLAAMPSLSDKGLLCKVKSDVFFVTNGAGYVESPIQLGYLPPVPLVAPNISMYCIADQAHADINGKEIEARICFTTVPLDAAMYTEIAETWGW